MNRLNAMHHPQPDPKGAASARAFLADNPGITSVDAVFADLSGTIRGKRMPAADLPDLFVSGLNIPETIYLLDVRGEMTDALGRGFTDGDPDGVAFPVPGTLVPVGKPPFTRAQVLMSLSKLTGEPCDIEPRAVLARVASRMAELKLKPVTAVELEFYLIDPKRVANGAPQPPICPTTKEREKAISVYGIWDLDRYQAFLGDVAGEAARWRVPATAATSEYAPGQFEINLEHVDDPVTACDHAIYLKQIIRNVARAHGFEASFMAKPYADRAGSGMHVHVSVAGPDGKNAFAAEDPAGAPILRHAIGGLQRIMHEAMAIFAPTPNAYRRFVPNLFVPVNRHWGINNRSTGLRVPAGGPNSRRIEHRVSGADANPYLVMAALLAGLHHGLASKIDPGKPFEGNASELPDPGVPFNFPAALAAMEKSSVLRSYWGNYVDVYVATKRVELERFNAIIPPHEHDWYL